MNRVRSVLLGILGVGLVLVVWSVWSRQSDSFYFPTVGAVLEAFQRDWLGPRFVSDAVPSLIRLGVGYLAACLLGVGLGLIIALNRGLADAMDPVAQFLRALPAPMLVPVGVLILGIGDTSKIAIIAFSAIWPILLNTVDGVRGVDARILETSAVYHIPRSARVRRVLLPAASPQIAAGMRTSLAIAIALMVISEMVASRNGLGYAVLESQRTFAIPEMWAGVLLLGAVGYLASIIFVQVERRLLRWHAGARGRAADF